MVVQKNSNNEGDSLVNFKLKRFSITLPSYDNQRVLGHAAKRTIGKAEMVRFIVQQWLDEHEGELQQYWSEMSQQTGLPIPELKLKIFGEYARHARRRHVSNDEEEDETFPQS